MKEHDHKALIDFQFTICDCGLEFFIRVLNEFDLLANTGDSPLSERLSLANSFQTSRANRVLVLSLRVGGLGLNLQEAYYVFHIDQWWKPIVERQAEDRIHRFGQNSKVNIVKYVCLGPLEEGIESILTSKHDLFDNIVDNVSIDPDLRSQLDRIEIFDLLNL